MKLKKVVALLLLSAISVGTLAGCAKKDEGTEKADGKKTELNVSVLEGGYGQDIWNQVVKAYEEVNKDVTVKLTIDKKIEDVISPNMKAGNYPDVVHLAVGREAGLTETLIKENALLDLTDVLSKTVPGENVKVSDKLVGGFTDTLVTNPYGDGKTYLAPMFYGPCGLFFNEGLFEQKGWSIPKTWDEMWELGDKAKAEGIALFTYPTTGYFDAFFFALLSETGGSELFNKAMNYEEGIWETPEAKQAFEIVGKLAKYTESTTVSNANDANYQKNQQLILDNKALFMPNGTWVTGEMKDAPRADGFKWGFTALPAVTTGGDSYSYTFFEQMWVPSSAKNQDAAKDFVAFMYSDKAADIFAQGGAIQPIKNISSKLDGENKLFYSIYDNGAKAAMGTFAATEPVEGVNMVETLFGTVNSIVSGDKTVDTWIKSVSDVSNKLRAAKK